MPENNNEGFDLKTTLKHLERLSAYRSYMMSPCEEEAVLCAIRHYRELVEAEKSHPMKDYEGFIKVKIKTSCYGRDKVSAESDLQQIADSLSDYVACADGADFEVMWTDIKVGEEIKNNV